MENAFRVLVLFSAVVMLLSALLAGCSCDDDDDEAPPSDYGDSSDDDDNDDNDDNDDDDDNDDNDDNDDDDDNDDNDDNDNDNNDDNDDDDDTVDCTWMIKDDGTMEGWYSSLADQMMASAHTPPSYPSYLARIEMYMAKGANPVFWEAVIFSDETGNEPDDAVEVWSSDPQTSALPNVPVGEWVAFDMEAELTGNPLGSGNWIIAVRFLDSELNVLVGLDRNLLDAQSYRFDGSNWTSLPSGTLMIRACQYNLDE